MSGNPLDKKSQGWSALFSEPMDALVQRYTVERDLRPAPVACRHRRQPGPCPHAGGAEDHRREGSGRHRTRAGADRRRHRGRPIRVETRTRGRAPEHRGAPDPTGGRRRQAAAYRALAQRPGRHRRAPVAARRDRRDRGAAVADAARAAGCGRVACRDRDARLHAPAGRATGESRAPPAGLCGDVRARRRASGRRAPPHQPAAAGRRRAGRHELPARPRGGGARARLRRCLRKQPRRGERPRLRDRVRRPSPRSRWCTCRAWPRRSCCG